jgi:thiol-disulfide isomerase/thioredoxin
MTSDMTLKWNDLISPTITPKEYLTQFSDKVGMIYKNYEPKKDILKKISTLLQEKKEKLKIVALGADWCPDCSRNIPRMIKITEKIPLVVIEFKILYGIVVNALHKPGEVIWHKKRSPPEAANPKFNLKAIPTFYFFNKDGKLLDVIIEKPKINSSLEEELLEILENHL